MLCRRQFFATPYGRGLWVSMWADKAIDWPLVVDLLRRSYRMVALASGCSPASTAERNDDGHREKSDEKEDRTSGELAAGGRGTRRRRGAAARAGAGRPDARGARQ